jgi:hypothetical protein
MSRVRIVVALVAAMAIAQTSASAQVVTESKAPADTLHNRFRVVKNKLAFSPVPIRYGKGWPEQPDMGQMCAITPLAAFDYIGGTRFILHDIADAEQHFFVRADADKVVRELLWLQIEEGIPGKSRGYTYASDSLRRFAGIEWRVDVRSTAGTRPLPGSDGAAMRAFVISKGYALPPMAPRVRLVYLPKPGGLKEFMIIHFTAASAAGADTTFSVSLDRAKNRFNLQICP